MSSTAPETRPSPLLSWQCSALSSLEIAPKLRTTECRTCSVQNKTGRRYPRRKEEKDGDEEVREVCMRMCVRKRKRQRDEGSERTKRRLNNSREPKLRLMPTSRNRVIHLYRCGRHFQRRHVLSLQTLSKKHVQSHAMLKANARLAPKKLAD